MKKITWILCLGLLGALPVLAQDAQGLARQAMESIQHQTSQMSALGISEDQARKMLMQMVRNRFHKQDMTRAQKVIVDAAKAGLPTEPVIGKAMEGMSKQAGHPQIIAAMETVRSRYSAASRMAKALSMDEKSTATMTRTIADSLTAGMQAEEMEVIMTQLRVQTRQQTRNQADNLARETLRTARTMARLGVHSGDVSDTLCQVLQNRYTHQEMKQLRDQMAKQAHQASPQQIASRHAGTIGKGGDQSHATPNGSGSGGSGSGGSGGSGSGGSGSGGGGSGGSGSGGSGSGGGGSGGSGSGGGGSGGGGSGGGGSGGGT